MVFFGILNGGQELGKPKKREQRKEKHKGNPLSTRNQDSDFCCMERRAWNSKVGFSIKQVIFFFFGDVTVPHPSPNISTFNGFLVTVPI